VYREEFTVAHELSQNRENLKKAVRIFKSDFPTYADFIYFFEHMASFLRTGKLCLLALT